MKPSAGDDAARRTLIEAVFDEALDLPPDRRGGWLAARCGPDEELRTEVEALLAALDRPDRLLDGGAAPFAALASTLVTDLGGQHTIGPYRIIREIGRGGMGAVYLADRNDGQYRHRVAIKLLLANPAADELRRRFLAERQILATLSHPNVAQLLDGGITDTGVPYLVIEYVDGVPITTYCEREAVGLERRLRLFQDVCAAIHHAHSNLVLHLDVKPANILVTRDGQVKLLDFGIAKLLASRPLESDDPVTRTDARPMTPAYASPEQIRGGPLSTASDVYALGLVLYELLAGVRAYETEARAPAEAFVHIAEHEPPRPSQRNTPIAGRLRGDLDAIVMMALRKEPDRRYGSADLLSADIGRYLEGQPVLAHRGSAGYRFRKLVRRHRAVAAAIALAVTALGGGAAAALWQARLAEREQARATEALAESEEVASFLVRMFEPSDPGRERRDTVSVTDLLRRGAERAERLGTKPLVQARMFDALSQAYRSLGRLAQSDSFATRALGIQSAMLGPRDLRVAAAMTRLAQIRRFRGEYTQADSLTRLALNTRRALLGGEHPDVAESLRQLSELAVFLGDLPSATTLIEEAVAIRRRLTRGDSLMVDDLNTLGSIYWRRGQIEPALGALREGEALARAAFPPPSLIHVGATMRLAERLGQLPEGRAEAARIARAALAEVRAALGEAHPAVALTLHQVGAVLGPEGGTEAELMIRQAVEIDRRVLPGDPALAWALAALARHLSQTGGSQSEAETLQREAIEIMARYFGRRHSAYAEVLGGMADLMIRRGALDTAEILHRDAVSLREATFGQRNPVVALTRLGLARVYAARGDLDAADSVYQESRGVLLAQSSEANPEVRQIDAARATLRRLGVHSDVGRPAVKPQ